MEQPQRDTGFGKFARILGMVMSFVYVTIGVALYTETVKIGIDPLWSKILGGGIILYGAFRFYRAFRGNPGH
jgi:hypothetical protein